MTLDSYLLGKGSGSFGGVARANVNAGIGLINGVELAKA